MSEKTDRQYAEDSMGTWKSVAGGHEPPSKLMTNLKGSRATENGEGRKDAEEKDGENKPRGKGKKNRGRGGGRGKGENKRQ